MNNFSHLNWPGSRQDTHERKLERTLRVVLFRRGCPDTMTLSDYQLGLLDAAEHARVRTHVARCPHCQAELTRLEAFLVERSAHSAAAGWISAAGFEWQRLVRAGHRAGQVIIRLTKEALSTPLDPLPVRGKSGEANDTAQAGVYRRIALHLEQTDGLDMQIEVQRSATAQDAWRVVVQAQAPERWPELAGTLVKVQAGTWSREVLTDEYGQAVVEGVPSALIDMMTIEVDPESSLAPLGDSAKPSGRSTAGLDPHSGRTEAKS